MATAQRGSFESLSLDERIKVATRGMSISTYANGSSRQLSPTRAREVERISSQALRSFNLKKKAEAA